MRQIIHHKSPGDSWLIANLSVQSRTNRYEKRFVNLAVFVLLAIVLLLTVELAQAETAATIYQVGVAKRDITPDYPIRLNGYGFRRAESEGVTHPIWAKALAISDASQQPFVLLTLDNLGVREQHVDEVARRLQKSHGILRERIAVTFTHTHTAPKVNGASDTIFSSPIPPEHQKHIDQYTDELIDAMEAVAVAALDSQQASTLEWSRGTVGFAKNRRPQGGPVDHSLPVLVVRSADTKDIRAIYATYACHCVSLSNNKISGDWAGFAQRAIEVRHPDAVAMVSIGCGSDANPDSGVVGDSVAVAAAQGGQIADEVERLLSGTWQPVRGQLNLTLSHIDLQLQQVPTREELEQLASTDNPAGYNAKFQLAKLDQGEQLQTAIRYPIQVCEFGDSLAMVFLAGEICCDYAIRLREELIPERLWLHGYSNDFCAYIPSERLLREGGYGGGSEVVYFALPSRLAPGLEQKIINSTCAQVSSDFHQPPGDATSHHRAWSVERSLAAITIKSGLIVEAVAAEPLVSDPVAIDFGADGRLWVAGMPDYSRYAEEEFEKHGNIRVLTDTDNDGQYDTSSVFVDGLRFPTDVRVWRNGVIVCDAPDVTYYEDNDADGKADKQTVLLTGFATHNAQARVNSLRWGLDNWLYGSCGLFGGTIRTSTGNEVALGQRDFRFRPLTGELEPVTGCTQQGRVRNDWGDWFGCENGSLLDHYPLVERYLSRNLRVIPPPLERSVPDAEAAILRPIGKVTLFKLSGIPGRATSVCGLEIYRDNLLGEQYSQNAFVAEPVNQLVHRMVLARNGATFMGHLAEDEHAQEFLASSDPWFRPVQVRTGPDGCLYIVDMHRAVIEHQKFIPPETLQQLNLFDGREQGRIYRVRPTGIQPRQVTDLVKLNSAELIEVLNSPNGPRRDQAHELLVSRGDSEVVPRLRVLASEAEQAATRVQVLGVLDGLEGLDVDVLSRTLSDSHPTVRRHAVRLSEPWLANSSTLAAKVVQLADDPDLMVQMQVAYSLGEWNSPEALSVLAHIALEHHDLPDVLTAVWSSLKQNNVGNFLNILTHDTELPQLPDSLLASTLRLAIEMGNIDEVVAIGEQMAESNSDKFHPWQLEVASALYEKVKHDSSKFQACAAFLTPAMQAAHDLIDEDVQADEAELLAALPLVLSSTDGAKLEPIVERLLSSNQTAKVQRRAVELMGQLRDSDCVDSLLSAWSGLSSLAREQAFSVIVGDPERVAKLLDRVGEGELPILSLDASQRQRLLQHPHETTRMRAENVLASTSNPLRASIVEEYLSHMNANGDVDLGMQHFAKHCSSCHQLENVGFVVGPDLAALTNLTKQALVTSVLDPNQAIDDRYRSVTALTSSGLVYTGILASETSGSISLLNQQGQLRSLLRADLEQLNFSTLSLMPEGFERELSHKDLNDLVEYLIAVGRKSIAKAE